MSKQSVGQRIGYARVSTTDQNLERQIEALGPVDKLFEEKHSGNQRADRPVLTEMITYARAGDTVVVASMDRAARSVVDLNVIVQELLRKNAVIEFVAERITFTPGESDPFAQFQLNVIGSFAQLERAIARERQAEGIRAAKARGVYQGRSRKLTDKELAKARALIDEGVPKTKVAARFHVGRATLYRALDRGGGVQ